MKKSLLSKLCIIFMVAIAYHGNLTAQVGINTTTPQAGSMLDVDSSDKGILVPRVNIANLSTIAPITGGATESLLVYNTNAITGIGYHYWDGSVWIPFLTTQSDDWTAAGNTGTIAGSNFIGTIDNVGLTFRTNNIQRFRMTGSGYLRAFSDGAAATPLFHWDGDTDTGFYHSGADIFNISSGGREMVEFYENGNSSEVVFNDGGARTNFRVESDNQANTLFISSANDNIGIGTNSPNTSAQIDMADTDRGILINRVALIATNNASPVTAPATGLFVYNTANSGSGSTEVLPGFYYWDGSQWIAMGGTGGRDWSLEGNAGTSLATNFLGTTDNTSMSIKTNDIERIQIDSDGTVGIGSLPYTNAVLRVNKAGETFGVIAETNSAGGVALYGEDIGTGLGIYGTSTNNHGIYGTTAYTGSAFLIGGIIGWGTGIDGSNGVLAVTDKIVSTKSNMGIRAVSGSTTSISSSQILNVGVNTNAIDLGLYAMSEGPITSVGDIETARFQTNYTGSTIDADARDPRAQLAGFTTNSQAGGGSMYYGGYLYSGGSSVNSSYSYAGARFNGTNYKIIGNGAVSTIVDGVDGRPKVMFAPEAPEVLFEDYGTGYLTSGIAVIAIDPIFTNNIIVNDEHPLKVFIQLEGECNGVYVSQKTANGFIVKELNSGSSNVSFSWHIVANRKDSGTGSENSSIYSSLRFPVAPNSIKPTLNTAVKAQDLDDSILPTPIVSSQINN